MDNLRLGKYVRTVFDTETLPVVDSAHPLVLNFPKTNRTLLVGKSELDSLGPIKPIQ